MHDVAAVALSGATEASDSRLTLPWTLQCPIGHEALFEHKHVKRDVKLRPQSPSIADPDMPHTKSGTSLKTT